MKKQRKPLKTILISFGVTVAVLAVSSGVFIYSELSKINTPETMEEIAPENEVFDSENNNDYGVNMPSIDPKDVVWPSGDKPAFNTPSANIPSIEKTSDDKKVISILLIGQDKRPGEKRARSDAMIIASYSANEGTLKLTSLMRDMYVPIPGYSDNRINAAYQFGGMPLLKKTIEKDFGVIIDGTIEVNFEGFTHVVDMMGGIDIELSKAEAAHLNKKYSRQLAGGVNHLDGQQTLEFARIRSVGNGDYERTDRQRTVLRHMYDSMMHFSLSKKYIIIDKMLPYLTTDMPKQEILGYAYMVLTHGVKSTKSYRIPADGTFETAKIRQMAVLVPNLTKTRALLKNYIYGDMLS